MKFTQVTSSILLFVSMIDAAPARQPSKREATLARLQNTMQWESAMPISIPGNPGRKMPNRPPTTLGSESNSSFAGTSAAQVKQYFANWAGALWVDSGITEVKGTTNVPQVSMPVGGSPAVTYGGAVWVGIDGDTCGSAILQTGIVWTIVNGQTRYSAWYEWFPAPLTAFENFEVRPGDSINMRVVATSSTSGTAYVTNLTTGQSVSKDFFDQAVPLCQQNAEWIVEDFSTNGSLIPFAGFSDVHITDANWLANGTTFGLQGAIEVNIQQNNRIMTNCVVSGSDKVDCSYTGNN